MLSANNNEIKGTIEPHLAINMLAHAFLFNQLRDLLERRYLIHKNKI